MARWRLVLAALITLPLLAGCAGQLPPGADGNLANGWATLPEPTAYEPKIGACIGHATDVVTASQMANRIVDCARSHEGQIVGGGQYPPAGSSTEADRANLAECDEQAAAFLKEDWRNGTLDIKVVKPQSATARDGARWWECVIIAVNAETLAPVELVSDLAAGIPTVRRFACQTATQSGANIENIKNVDCAVAHHAEFAGAMAFPAGTPFPTNTSQWATIHAGCQVVVGKYVGVSSQRVRVYSTVMRNAQAWPDRRDVRCFAYFGGKTMTGSAKGTGGAGVPW